MYFSFASGEGIKSSKSSIAATSTSIYSRNFHSVLQGSPDNAYSSSQLLIEELTILLNDVIRFLSLGFVVIVICYQNELQFQQTSPEVSVEPSWQQQT